MLVKLINNGRFIAIISDYLFDSLVFSSEYITSLYIIAHNLNNLACSFKSLACLLDQMYPNPILCILCLVFSPFLVQISCLQLMAICS